MRYEKTHQEVVFAIERYEWGNTREEARADMWRDIATMLKLLVANNYVAVVRDDDTDIIVVEFEHDNNRDDWGTESPHWITRDDYDDLMFSKEQKEAETEDVDLPFED